MKNIFFLVLVITLYSCSINTTQQKKNNAFFEGEIVYQLDYDLSANQLADEILKERIGSKMVLSFKEGNYLEKYFSPNGNLLEERFLTLAKNKLYMRKPDIDTIYWVDLTRNDSKSTFKQINDSIIIEEPCIGVATETIVTGPGFGDNAYKVSSIFYYSKRFKVDPNWYKDCNEGNLNEIIKIGQGVRLMQISQNPYWQQTKTAISIERKNIDDKNLQFIIPEHAILKEL